MKMQKLILPLCLSLLFCSCNDKKEKTDDTLTVQVTPATIYSDASRKEFTFISHPFRSSELSFRVSGPIQRFEVYAGNYYKRGEIIAEIDPRDFQIRKEKAEAIYIQAKTEFERIKTLYEKNNISASTYEKTRADYISAKTAFKTTTNELNDTKLLAPFDGYIGEIFIENFQEVKASQPIFTFIDIHQLKIETFVNQEVASAVQKLKMTTLVFDALPEKIYEAPITEISKNTTSNNLSYLLTVLLPNPDHQLPAGMSGKLYIDLSQHEDTPLVIIPQQALCHRPSLGDYVWIINPTNEQVALKKVNVKQLLPNGQITLKDGLQGNEQIITSGLRFLSEGMTVNIQTTNN